MRIPSRYVLQELVFAIGSDRDSLFARFPDTRGRKGCPGQSLGPGAWRDIVRRDGLAEPVRFDKLSHINPEDLLRTTWWSSRLVLSNLGELLVGAGPPLNQGVRQFGLGTNALGNLLYLIQQVIVGR